MITLIHNSYTIRQNEQEDKNQKAKTVNMKKGRKKGEGVWLGTVSGVGTPDTTDAVSRASLRGQPYMGRVWGFSAAQAQPLMCLGFVLCFLQGCACV
jgi:hypothetical protein